MAFAVTIDYIQAQMDGDERAPRLHRQTSPLPLVTSRSCGQASTRPQLTERRGRQIDFCCWLCFALHTVTPLSLGD